MTKEEFHAILAGEREADLSESESAAFEEFLESEEGRDLLANAERELEPLASAFDPAPPASWTRVDEAVRAEVETGGRVVVTPPEVAKSRAWGGTLLLAASLLFAGALGLAYMGPGKKDKTDIGAFVSPPPSPGATPSKQGGMWPAPLTTTPDGTLPLAGDPAVALELKPGKDYEAESETTPDGSLLIVTVRTKSSEEH